MTCCASRAEISGVWPKTDISRKFPTLEYIDSFPHIQGARREISPKVVDYCFKWYIAGVMNEHWTTALYYLHNH
jgi:hypothetical protein